MKGKRAFYSLRCRYQGSYGRKMLSINGKVRRLHGPELSMVLKDQKCNAIQIRMLRSNQGWKAIST